ncbi:hypothetical protein AX14_008704, partial [Amanita brunnescens Koide BX004]
LFFVLGTFAMAFPVVSQTANSTVPNISRRWFWYHNDPSFSIAGYWTPVPINANPIDEVIYFVFNRASGQYHGFPLNPPNVVRRSAYNLAGRGGQWQRVGNDFFNRTEWQHHVALPIAMPTHTFDTVSISRYWLRSGGTVTRTTPRRWEAHVIFDS